MRQLHPRAVWLFFIRFIISWGILLIIVLGFIFGIQNASPEGGLFPFSLSSLAILFLLLGYAIFAYIWARLSYHFYRYELIENSFRKEFGVIWKSYISIPYDRIQNIDIYRGIWARIFGLSELHIQTAGASGRVATEGRLPGLSKEEAELLREDLISRVSHQRGQGL